MTVNSVTPAASTNVIANLGGAYSENFPMAANFQQGGRIDLPNSINLFRLTNSVQSLSIAGWLKWNGQDAHPTISQGIVSTMPGGQNNGWCFAVRSDGTLGFVLGGTAGTRYSTNAIVVPTNPPAWTHVAMVYAAASDPTFYI